MSRLVLTWELLEQLRGELLRPKEETCAILLGRSINISGRLARIVVQECIRPEIADYSQRSPIAAQLKPEFVAGVVQRARLAKQSVIFVHTHPFPMNRFSKVDDEGETALAALLEQRIPEAVHAALLLTPEQSLARVLGKSQTLTVVGCGIKIDCGHQHSIEVKGVRYDRQVRAFGLSGQRIIKALRIGIVGLGGTGSIVLQSLAHLGAEDLLLLDPDTVEESNLNRLVGASPKDVGRPKVDVAKDLALKINQHISIEVRQESVLLDSVAKRLIDSDFVFCCTDSHGSRAVLNQLAYQYLIPMIDMGVVIATKNETVTHIAARTQLLSPGMACMVCGNLLDAEEVRRDLLTDFERKSDPYIKGDIQPAPAVISLNGTIASLPVTMLLNTAVGVPGTARHLNYNGLTGHCRPAYCHPHPRCVVCSPHGALTRADDWPLPARQE